MTFTYTVSTTPTDLTKVRLAIGDTVSTTAMWTDEEINMQLAVEGSVGAAAISLVEARIAQLNNEPDMKADWLQVDWQRAMNGLLITLAKLKAKYGLGWVDSSGGQHSYRPDTLQKEPPDYGEE